MIGVFFLFVLVFAVVFWLYGLPVQAVLYPAAICGALGVLFLISDIRRERSKHRRLCELEALPAPLMSGFPGGNRRRKRITGGSLSGSGKKWQIWESDEPAL